MNGWENFIFKSEVTEQLAEDRAVHCATCKHLSKSLLLSFLRDNLKQIEGYECGICSCPISAKIRSVAESCPINKW